VTPDAVRVESGMSGHCSLGGLGVRVTGTSIG
jgi:hypothetical protein